MLYSNVDITFVRIKLCQYTNINATIAIIFTVSLKRWEIVAAHLALSANLMILKKLYRLLALFAVNNHVQDVPEITALIVNNLIFKEIILLTIAIISARYQLS